MNVYEKLCGENDANIRTGVSIQPKAFIIKDGVVVETINLPLKPKNHDTVQKALKSYIAKQEKLEGYVLIMDTIPKTKAGPLPMRCCMRILYTPKDKKTEMAYHRNKAILGKDTLDGRNPVLTDKWDYWARA